MYVIMDPKIRWQKIRIKNHKGRMTTHNYHTDVILHKLLIDFHVCTFRSTLVFPCKKILYRGFT